MEFKHYALVVIIIALIAAVSWFGFVREAQAPAVPTITSFEECAAAGFPVAESYPRQCWDEAGNHFVEDVTANWEVAYTNASEDLIRNINIQAGDTITSPLTITGEARGYWFFEASFPVTLTNWDGLIIAQHYAQFVPDLNDPESTWMTEEFIPFTSTIEFETPPGPGGPLNRGFLILQRDNPSGLPENDAALEIPVVFE